jgi:hypothetical protein
VYWKVNNNNNNNNNNVEMKGSNLGYDGNESSAVVCLERT